MGDLEGLPGFDLAQSQTLLCLESEPIEEKYLLSLTLSITVPFKSTKTSLKSNKEDSIVAKKAKLPPAAWASPMAITLHLTWSISNPASWKKGKLLPPTWETQMELFGFGFA